MYDHQYPVGSLGWNLSELRARINALPWPLSALMRRRLRRLETMAARHRDRILVEALDK